LDLRDPDSSSKAVRAAVEHAGRLDVVVNAVGVVAFGPIDDVSVDAVEELFMTNTFIPIFLGRSHSARCAMAASSSTSPA
jgi:cyclic-di-GMP-binding biofilm dispersal mediator protein